MSDLVEEQRSADALWEIARLASGILQQLTIIQEQIMSAIPTGLAALQAFVTSFQAFATQQANDLASLTTSINAAITALENSGASEDSAVQTAVASLQTALSTVTANETALETLNTSLTAAEAPPAAQSKKK
jgi:hypothetical protein